MYIIIDYNIKIAGWKPNESTAYGNTLGIMCLYTLRHERATVKNIKVCN